MIVVVGLSHRTAPIAVRERLAIPQDALPVLLSELVALPEVREAMVVNTCNRMEVIAAGVGDGPSEMAAAASAIREALNQRAPGVDPHLYTHVGAEAVLHLFRVAASLDSLVLGEPQILGQLKQGYDVGRHAKCVGPRLHRAVPRAIHAAKRVRTETSIGAGMVSVPSVAVDLARQIFGDFTGRTVVLIGSGEMAETVARLLTHAGSQLLVVGRNPERVQRITRAVGGEPKAWNELGQALTAADVVITSTSAPGYVIDYETVAKLRRARRGRSLFFIDLAVPRDVDPRVESIDGVFPYNIDDFSRVVAETLSTRRREADAAEAIIVEEAEKFQRWSEADQVTPTVVALRQKVLHVLRSELDKSLRGKLRHLGDAERDALALMIEASVKKLLHAPTRELRAAASEREFVNYRSESLVRALHELFDLDAADSDDASSGDTWKAAAGDVVPLETARERSSGEPFADSDDDEQRASEGGSR